MGYNLNFDEIRNLQSSLMSSVCGWQDLYSQIGTELTGFTGTMGYTGAGGTAIRNYVQEVHGVVCQCLSLLLAEYTGRLLLFGEGLYEYDSDKHACLNEDALAAVGERLEHVAEDLAGLHETARREMQKITDQVDTACHSGVEEYVTALYNKRTELREYRERIGEYDHTSAAGLEEMKELVSTLRGLADRLYEGGEIRAEAWEPGSFLTGEELEHLAGLVMNSGRFLAENGEAVSAAYEHYTQVWEEIIEELSEERVKQGALLVLASAVAIAGVILSAGTLAPEITATLGIAVAAYNSSNLLEGAQDIYYGLNGDPYTLAYNPMCETLFQGNREAYDLFGLTVNSAYAVVVPLNQFACATSTTGQVMVLVDVGAGAVTDYGVTRICEAAGADDMTTFIMGFGAGMLTGMAVDSLNPSVPRRPGSMEMDSGEFHTTIRELQRKGYLGDGNSLPSSFADMMSPEDAARYTYYLENGSSLPSTYAVMMSPEDAAQYTHFLEYGGNSGLTPSEMAGIQRLDDCLALSRVDYDEVLTLRRQNGVGFWDEINNYSAFGEMSETDGIRYEAWNVKRQNGLDLYDEYRIIQQGKKSNPTLYLSKEYINTHLLMFDDGASILVTRDAYDNFIAGKNIIGYGDNTQFIMPKSICDNVALSANGDIAVYEEMLGFRKGYFKNGGGLVRIDIEDLSGLELRIPSGNEAGANEFWIPGGYTSGGVPEAIVNCIPSDRLMISIVMEE